MNPIRPSRFLKLALRADALASGAVAALQLLLAGVLAETLQLPRALLVESGAFLVAYAILLLWLTGRAQLHAAWIGLIIGGNVAWALACMALWLSGLVSPSLAGAGFLLLQALTVLALALLELQGLQRSRPAEPRLASAGGVS
jgi:hypothetical protein